MHRIFQKVALLEILRTHLLLTRVAGLQYIFSNATKYELITEEGLPEILQVYLKRTWS